MTPEQIVVEALEAVGCRPRQTLSGMSFRCPVPGHRRNDKRPSGRLNVSMNGTVLLWCGRGHSADEIVTALGLEMTALFPEGGNRRRDRRPSLHVVTGGTAIKPPRLGRPEIGGNMIAFYSYVNADGVELYRVGRTDDKAFPVAHVDPVHGWIWGHPPDSVKALYGLPAVLDGVERGARIFLVEGEKDAIRLNTAFPDRIDYVATTKMGGAKSAWLPQYTRTLTGAHVTIIADRDSEGKWAAAQAAKALMGCARSLTIVEAREGKDASDHLEAGFGLSDFVVLASDSPVAVLA